MPSYRPPLRIHEKPISDFRKSVSSRSFGSVPSSQVDLDFRGLLDACSVNFSSVLGSHTVQGPVHRSTLFRSFVVQVQLCFDPFEIRKTQKPLVCSRREFSTSVFVCVQQRCLIGRECSKRESAVWWGWNCRVAPGLLRRTVVYADCRS